MCVGSNSTQLTMSVFVLHVGVASSLETMRAFVPPSLVWRCSLSQSESRSGEKVVVVAKALKLAF